MAEQRPRDIAYDDMWWPDPSPMGGSAGYVSADKPDESPMILVPDGKGDYREYRVAARPTRRLGF